MSAPIAEPVRIPEAWTSVALLAACKEVAHLPLSFQHKIPHIKTIWSFRRRFNNRYCSIFYSIDHLQKPYRSYARMLEQIAGPVQASFTKTLALSAVAFLSWYVVSTLIAYNN